MMSWKSCRTTRLESAHEISMAEKILARMPPPFALSSFLFPVLELRKVKSAYISFRRALWATVPVSTDRTVAQGAAHGTVHLLVTHPTHTNIADCAHGSLFSELPHTQ